MKLNSDCIRDVLLYLENNLEYSIENKTLTRIEWISWHNVFEDNIMNTKYDIDDIKYSIQKLYEAHFVKAKIATGAREAWISCDITDITWNGHEFLNAVRGQTIWEATKNQASKLGGASIKTLETIAMSITQAVVTNPSFIQNIVDKIIN